jgi:hypothetical protein
MLFRNVWQNLITRDSTKKARFKEILFLMHRELARASPLLEYLRLSHGSLLDLNVT